MSMFRKLVIRAGILMIGLLLLQVGYPPVLAQNPSLELISVAYDGTAANNVSFDPTISADGRYIVFESTADNLVPGYDNGHDDVYLATNPLWTPLDVPSTSYYTALPIALTWSPVSGAVAYEVQVADNTSFNEATTTVVAHGDLFLKIDTLADGVYYWRVRTKNGSGGAGAWSAVQTFTLDTTP